MQSMKIPDLCGLRLTEDGEITLCEVDGKVHSMPQEFANLNTFTTSVEKHPKIHVSRDMLHRVCSGDESRALFLPVHESFLKQLVQIYYEHGFLEALRTTAERREHRIVSTPALIVSKLIDNVKKIRSSLNPYAKESGPKLVSLLSQTREWQSCPVRCIAWHTFCTKLAVSTSDDSVRIYSTDTGLVPILKCRQQKNITCLSWRPLSASEIAVGCDGGVFVWNVDPCSSVARPSVNHATVLRRVNHSPVLSLAWSPLGDVLASGAALDGTIFVWNVELDQTSSLRKPGASGNVLLKWSPDGSKMFSSTIGLVFRVWDCNKWEAERWNVLTGRVSSACWSPNSSILLFTTSEEPTIYSLSFAMYGEVFNVSNNTPEIATPVADLTRVEIDGLTVGGIVQSMEWDPKGTHLAVIFKDTNAIPVFVTTMKPTFQITPSFLISGLPDEIPNAMEFQKNFNYGACLTIAWSSGRIQYFPIIYSESNFNSLTNSPQTQHLNSTVQYNSFTSPSNSFYVIA